MIRFWHSHKHQLNFLGIPKTGSTSVRKWLDIDVENDWNWTQTFDYPTFTVIREPIHRIFSAYNELRRQGACHDEFEFFDKIQAKGYFDVHCMPMKYFLAYEDGEFVDVDHILILENGLKRELSKIAKIKGAYVENKSPSTVIPEHFKTFVKKYYAEDLELYKNAVSL